MADEQGPQRMLHRGDERIIVDDDEAMVAAKLAEGWTRSHGQKPEPVKGKPQK